VGRAREAEGEALAEAGEVLRTAVAILRGRMAVPKKKTSKSRRDKRRAQHGIESPRVNICPTCGQPKRPHRVCPNCKTYKGRDVEPLATPLP
jgi:large subunit ribosomal protein L32